MDVIKRWKWLKRTYWNILIAQRNSDVFKLSKEIKQILWIKLFLYYNSQVAMIHACTGELLHLCSIKSIHECKIASLKNNILRLLGTQIVVYWLRKTWAFFSSHILILFLLCFATPTLKHQFTSYQLSPVCDFLPHLNKVCPISSSSSQMNMDGKKPWTASTVFYKSTFMSYLETLYFKHISICYKFSELV